MQILACALFLAAQSGDLFQLPQIRSVAEEPPAGCERARKRAAEILAEIDKEITAAMKAFVREVAADLEPGQTAAEGWDQAAALAVLNADPATALWAELQALKLQWDSTFATNAGIYLHYLDKRDDAKLFLHCAYDMGARSPFLLEALANVYRQTGDKEQARIFIGEAAAAAPGDALIESTKSLAETGRPPPPPPPQPADPLERALAELERHQQRVLGAVKQALDLQNRVTAAGGVPETTTYVEGSNRELLAGLRQGFESGCDSVRSMLPQAKNYSGEGRRMFRNAMAYTLITLYLSTTKSLFTLTTRLDNPWSGSSTLDLGFWGEVLGIEPVQLTRMFRELRDFEVEGHKAGVIGGWLDDFGGAPFHALEAWAAEQRHEGSLVCGRAGGSPAAQKACQLEVDRKYCATLREIFRSYVAESERWFQRGARGFDRVAERRIALGGIEVEQAFVYAATYAKELRIPPGDTQGKDMLKSLQAAYLELLDAAAGSPESGCGPGYLARDQAEIFRLQKENSELSHQQIGVGIERTCEPVDRRVLEQLIEERRKAIQSMLLDRLKRDFDAEWDPTVSCSFSAGKWFQAGIDDTGKVSLGGKWKWLQKKFPGRAGLPDEVEVARNYKVNFEDGRFLGVSAGVEGSAKYGPFTGKGSATIGVAWNSKKNDWDFPVEFGGTLGIGFKTKGDFGATCYPGKARIRFEARAVARDAYEYVRSLDPE